MKTDTLFYTIFLDFPEIFFELINQPIEQVNEYEFTSQAVKEQSFTVDGFYCPFQDNNERPFYLVEVQFQPKENFYYRLFGELFIYLRQYQPLSPWRIVIIYPNRQVERLPFHQFREMVSLDRVQRFYLDELDLGNPPSLGLGILKLVVENETEAVNSAKLLINQAKVEIIEPLTQKNVLNLIETIIIQKLPLKTTKEIETMLDLQDLKQTKVYQEGREEGREEGEQQGEAKLVLRQLQRRFGEIPETVQETIKGLSIEQLEELGIALLDFNSQSDLLNWF
ncbi:MAG: Rpn family recombination-promoting nuclease/putative transposase [Microcystaceae cyanobacterium]